MTDPTRAAMDEFWQRWLASNREAERLADWRRPRAAKLCAWRHLQSSDPRRVHCS